MSPFDALPSACSRCTSLPRIYPTSRILPSRRYLRLTHIKYYPPYSRPPERLFSTTGARSEPSNAVRNQLLRVEELHDRVSAETKQAEKGRIIAEYPDLRELLELVYHPFHRVYVTSPALLKFIDIHGVATASRRDPELPKDLEALLIALSQGYGKGNWAKSLVSSFLVHHGVVGDPRKRSKGDELVVGERGALGTFLRILDRNLVAGFGARTLYSVPWPGSAAADALTSTTPIAPSWTVDPGGPKTRKPKTFYPSLLDAFSPALGKLISPPFTDIINLKRSNSRWYASRKLDGVRVFALMDFFVPSDPAKPVQTQDVIFISRAGREFHSLVAVRDQLGYLAGFDKLREWLERDPVVLEDREGGVVKRLVLDGEVCVMRHRTKVEEDKRRVVPVNADGAESLWSERDDLVEDFAATVSAIRRQVGWIPHPRYFIFDTLSWAEVENKSAVNEPGLGRRFGLRVEDTRELIGFLDAELQNQGVEERMVTALLQLEMSHLEIEDVDELVAKAAEEGWEGLIFRADKPYRGSRTKDMRKFKEWKDAEYVVKSLETSVMRLSIDGVFAERKACSRVWIEHKGTPVSVGSGFTADERVRYANDPSLIVGKEITVQYFSESRAIDREGVSLRFPRVKKVWEEGRRDV